MKDIASQYMQKIGFGKQPYLVYRHNDAGHPHIHIVSTNIQKDGSRISLHNLGRNQSETARKEIEKEFGLVKAENRKRTDVLKVAPVNANRITYGNAETKRAIIRPIFLKSKILPKQLLKLQAERKKIIHLLS